MQSEYALPSADLGLLDSATGAPMTAAIAVARDGDADNQRWLAWRARGARIDRQTALTMRRAFIAIFVVLSGWLVVQLLS